MNRYLSAGAFEIRLHIFIDRKSLALVLHKGYRINQFAGQSDYLGAHPPGIYSDMLRRSRACAISHIYHCF